MQEDAALNIISAASWSTADICDWRGESIQYLDSFEPFRHFSQKKRKFCGRIRTVQCFEDNTLVKELLSTHGEGCVLIIDGGGSLRRALVGDMIAGLAITNKWEGVVLYGAVRDSEELATMELGVVALGTNPRKCERRGFGVAGIPVRFHGATFRPGEYVYVDSDGVVTSATPVIPPQRSKL